MIKVRGVRWYIKEVEDLKHDDGEKCDGICDFKSKTIKIDPAQKGKAYTRTFLHEYFHAFLHEAGIGCHLSTEVEETLVRNMESEFEGNAKMLISCLHVLNGKDHSPE